MSQPQPVSKQPPALVLLAMGLVAAAFLLVIWPGRPTPGGIAATAPAATADVAGVEPATTRIPADYAAILPGAQRVNADPFPVVSLASDGDRLWVGSDLRGLYVLEGEALRPLHAGLIYSLLPVDENQVLAGYGYFPGQEPVSEIRDEAGGVAFLSRPVYLSGECENGLARWDGRGWTGLWTQAAVWDLARDEESLYLATNDGVYLFQDGQARRLGLAETLSFSLLYDPAAATLYAGARGGVWRYAAGLGRHVLDLARHKALDLARDEDGTFYTATTAGLYISTDGLTWRRVGEELSLATLAVTPMGVYAGGSGGVFALQGDTLINVAPHPEVRALAWHQGRLYAGTNAGLWRLETP